ncbi:MAG: hexameric tyrosine-coordinated heme protein [Opitutales bacterium]
MNTDPIRITLISVLALSFAITGYTAEQPDDRNEATPPLSLITADADAGFQLAITLARKGVTETQPDRDVLSQQREVYSRDADSLIAASQVIAIHFQTIAAANDYWRDE